MNSNELKQIDAFWSRLQMATYSTAVWQWCTTERSYRHQSYQLALSKLTLLLSIIGFFGLLVSLGLLGWQHYQHDPISREFVTAGAAFAGILILLILMAVWHVISAKRCLIALEECRYDPRYSPRKMHDYLSHFVENENYGNYPSRLMKIVYCLLGVLLVSLPIIGFYSLFLGFVTGI